MMQAEDEATCNDHNYIKYDRDGLERMRTEGDNLLKAYGYT
jgi:hypothetical protein